MAHHLTPGQADALAAYARQLEGIRQLFSEDDRPGESLALPGADIPPQSTVIISIDEWGALLGTVKARLRMTVGEMHRPGVNDTPQAVRASVLECVDALDQLHVMLGDALSAQVPPRRRDAVSSPVLGRRRAAAPSHVSGVPVSSIPVLKPIRAAAAKD